MKDKCWIKVPDKFRSILRKIPKENAADLFLAYMDYYQDGTPSEFEDPLVDALFEALKCDADALIENENKRSEAGRKAGSWKRNKPDSDSTICNDDQRSSTNVNDFQRTSTISNDDQPKRVIEKESNREKEEKSNRGTEEENQTHSVSNGVQGSNHAEGESAIAPVVPPRAAGEPKKSLNADSKAVLEYLNNRSGHNYKPVESNLKEITARLHETGVTVDICKRIIDNRVEEWKGRHNGDFDGDQCLNPQTIFRKSNFWRYHGQLNACYKPRATGSRIPESKYLKSYCETVKLPF